MRDQLRLDKAAGEQWQPLPVFHFESHDGRNVHGLLAVGVSIAYRSHPKHAYDVAVVYH